MTLTRPAPSRSPLTSAPRLAVLAAAGALVLGGCSIGGEDGGGAGASSGSGTSCTLTGCTVTLQRGVDAKASVLGVDVQLVGVTGDAATLRIGGQQVTVPLDGQASTTVAGFDVTVQSADSSKIVAKISKA